MRFTPADFARPPAHPTAADLDDPATFALLCEQVKLDGRRNALPQVEALMAAGWTFELPASHDPEPWQWYWRRPPRRKGAARGRFFASTNQAYNALMREKPPAPDEGG